MGSSRFGGSRKARLKWTQELHNLFEKTVNQLGGPDRATPKGILKAMRIPGLTIYQVKSHLQNYRMSKFISETPNKNKFQRSNSYILPNFSATVGAQLHEALQMQIGEQRRLSDQIEVQRNLKVKVEAQGRFLERIAEEYKSRSNINVKPIKSFFSTSHPYLCKESESDIKESKSDSAIKNLDIRFDEKFQGSKRIHVDQKDVYQYVKLLLQDLALNSTCLSLKDEEHHMGDWSPEFVLCGILLLVDCYSSASYL